MDDVLTVQQDRFVAMIRRDVAALDRLLAKDLTYIHTTGLLESKSDFLESVASGLVLYRAIRPYDLHVRRYGEVAIVTGSSRMDITTGDVELAFTIRFTDVYLLDAGHWRQMAWQSTRLPEE
jgi:hypothetical protein